MFACESVDIYGSGLVAEEDNADFTAGVFLCVSSALRLCVCHEMGRRQRSIDCFIATEQNLHLLTTLSQTHKHTGGVATHASAPEQPQQEAGGSAGGSGSAAAGGSSGECLGAKV